MQEFMFFIRKQNNSEETLSPDVHRQFLQSCERYIGRLQSEGKLISAQPIVWNGSIISGPIGEWKAAPFNEASEVIGGYYHIRAENLEEAIAIAKANPEFEYNPGTRIEVRPLKMKEDSTAYEYPSKG